jgi:hypothetical protein
MHWNGLPGSFHTGSNLPSSIFTQAVHARLWVMSWSVVQLRVGISPSAVTSVSLFNPSMTFWRVKSGPACSNLARSITIGDGGAAEVETSGTTRDATVDPATVEQIVAELEASGLFHRDRRYDAEGADLQRYEIRYAGATVVAFDTAVPGELTGAIELLEAAIRAARTG